MKLINTKWLLGFSVLILIAMLVLKLLASNFKQNVVIGGLWELLIFPLIGASLIGLILFFVNYFKAKQFNGYVFFGLLLSTAAFWVVLVLL